MRVQLLKVLGLSVLAVSLTGCTIRLKGVESFNSATTPVKYSSSDPNREWKGDPYSFGGTANGSGGLNAKTSYGAGAQTETNDPIDPRLDQPAKGIGQLPGEYHAEPGNGYGQSNAPIAQPSPSSVESVSTR